MPWYQPASWFSRRQAAVQEGVTPRLMSDDPDLNLTAEQGGALYMNRVTRSQRDLPTLDGHKMREVAFYLNDVNPFAKRILRITRDMILGDGLTVQADASGEVKVGEGEGEEDTERERLQQVIDQHWDDPVNQWDRKLRDKVLELYMYGDQCWPAFVNPKDGHVRWGYIDPSVVKEVLTHPKNPELPVAVVVQPDVLGQGVLQVYKVIQVCEDPNSEWYGRLMGAATDANGVITETYTLDGSQEAKPYDGSVFFYATNKVSNATRGRSELLPVADWVDALDQLTFGEVERAALMKNFIWDVKVGGADEPAIQKMIAASKPPKPGTVRYHNEKTEWQAISPDLKSADAATLADLVLWPISTGAGVPKPWLAGTHDVNKATATTLSEPTYKEMSAKQREIKYILRQVITFVLDQAEMANQLPKRPAAHDKTLRPAPWKFSIQAPELRQRDLEGTAATLGTVASALTTLRADLLVDKETAQQVVVTMLGQLGVEVDLKLMRERLAKEEEDKALDPYANPRIGPGGELLPPLPPGANAGDEEDPGDDARVKGVPLGQGPKRKAPTPPKAKAAKE